MTVFVACPALLLLDTCLGSLRGWLPSPGNTDFPIHSSGKPYQLAARKLAAVCRQGCNSFSFEGTVLLPSLFPCWPQWLFSHYVSGVLHVQARILVGKGGSLPRVPLHILSLLDLRGFLKLEKGIPTAAPHTCKCMHTHTRFP